MEYLAFVDFIGRGVNDEYLYRFDYTENPDLTWGDFFNIVPCNIIPNLQPEVNNISHSEKVISMKELNLAKTNGCFSMQDCIDGVISMAFSSVGPDIIELNGSIVKFDFGMEIDEVHSILEACPDNFKLVEVIEQNDNDDEIIDKLIDTLNGRKK